MDAYSLKALISHGLDPGLYFIKDKDTSKSDLRAIIQCYNI